MQEVGAARQSLASINEGMSSITDMSVQIATAAEEQSAVAEEINRNIVAIGQVAEDTAGASRETHTASEQLSGLVKELQSMVRQFGV